LARLVFFWTSYFDFRAKILATYEDMGYNVENFIFLDEDLYAFCSKYNQEANNNSCRNCTCLKDIELFKQRHVMSAQFVKLHYDINTLGKMMSYQSYFEIHQLTGWNNLIMGSNNGICGSGLLVPQEKMDIWRNQILNRLSSERELHKGIVYSLKNYLLYLLTDIENERYQAFEVNLDNLPIYQKKENHR